MAEKKLKDWFDKTLAEDLAKRIAIVEPKFDSARFVGNVSERILPLELKDRIEVFADELFIGLDRNYPSALIVLNKILGPENPNEIGMFTEYYWISPIAKFVEKYGLDHFEISMKAIEEITKRNTSEFAIRPFLVNHFALSYEKMISWSKHPNFHVRRLSSEGIRPRLPWAKKMDISIKDPNILLPILENLKDDKSKYVQNSVANSLNDILKDNFDFGKSILMKWSEGEISKERSWIINHAIRNYRKAGESWALEMVTRINKG